MNEHPNYVYEVNTLDIFQKAIVWNHYNCRHLSLKYGFHWWLEPEMKHRNPDYLHKNIYRMGFEEFISDNNIKVTDNGENWQKFGFAQRIRTDYLGIYDWYWKFKDEIFK